MTFESSQIFCHSLTFWIAIYRLGAMTRLQDLPEDVLAQILVGETSVAALALWRTFNRQLRAKLINGGINHLELGAVTVGNHGSWPRYLNLFKLRSLTIDLLSCSSELRTGPMVKGELQRLWHGLETLEIRSCNFHAVFKLGEEVESIKKATDTHRGSSPPAGSIEYCGSNSGDTISDDWDMTLTHPNLKSLILGTRWILAPSSLSSRLDFGNVGFLPRSLTHLDLCQHQLEFDMNLCLNLPPQLTFLCFDTTKSAPPITGELIDYLPHSLTEITSNRGTRECYDMTALVKLANPARKCLPNLATFPYNGPAEYWYLIYRQHRAWPVNVCFMHLTLGRTEGRDHIDWRNLNSIGYPQEWLPENMITHLPKTLTSLKTSRITWSLVPENAAYFWPPNLTSMALQDSKCFRNFALLPRTLKTLEIHGYDPGSSSTCSLTDARHCLENLDIDLWRSIKAQLRTHRDSQLVTAGARKGVDSFIHEVEAGGLLGLPLTLTSLDINSGVGEISFLIPPLVTRAVLVRCSTHHPIQAISPFLTDLRVSVRPGEIEALSSYIDHRDSSITSLSISAPRPGSRLLGLFPRNLRSLTIDTTPMFYRSSPATMDATALRKLPSTLTALHIAIMVSGTNWIRGLPRSLLRLTVAQPIEAEDYEHLPPQLQFLKAHAPTLPFIMDQIDARPKTLFKAILESSLWKLDAPPVTLVTWYEIHCALDEVRQELLQ